jgi:hypothetical protein
MLARGLSGVESKKVSGRRVYLFDSNLQKRDRKKNALYSRLRTKMEIASCTHSAFL